MASSFKYVDRWQTSLRPLMSKAPEHEPLVGLLEERDQQTEDTLSSLLNPIRCRVWSNSAQSIPDATLTDLTFNQTSYDPYNMHDAAGSATTIIIPKGGEGEYSIGASVAFASSAVGTRSLAININGVGIVRRNVPAFAGTGGFSLCIDLALDYHLNDGDTVGASVYQSSGGALTMRAAEPNATALFLRRIA